MNETVKFKAEIRSVSSKKLISNDIEYKLVLTTEDNRIIDLAKLPSECIVDVHIEISKQL